MKCCRLAISTDSLQLNSRPIELRRFSLFRINWCRLSNGYNRFRLSTSRFKSNQNNRAFSGFDDEPQATLQRLRDYQELHQKFMRQHSALFQSSRTELEQQQQALSASLQEFTQRYTHLDQLEQQVQQFQIQQQQLSTQHSKLEALMRTVQQMAGLETESLQLNRELESYHDRLKQLETELVQLQQQRQEAEQAFEQLQQVLVYQRLLQAQSVQELRAQLKPNEPCMVCGSHEHPFVQHQELLENALQQLHDQQLEEAQKNYSN